MTNRSSDDQNYAAHDRALRRLAAWAALIVAIVLVALKLAAWIATGSVALLSSAIDALRSAKSVKLCRFILFDSDNLRTFGRAAKKLEKLNSFRIEKAHS